MDNSVDTFDPSGITVNYMTSTLSGEENFVDFSFTLNIAGVNQLILEIDSVDEYLVNIYSSDKMWGLESGE